MLENVLRNVKRTVATGLLASTLLFAPSCDDTMGWFGDPEINHTFVPLYGEYENLEGQVKHAKPSDYRVSTYIKVGSSWWMKPYWNKPLTTIDKDGSWITDITTGGVDSRATQINSYLVTPDFEPQYHTLPALDNPKVVDMVSTVRSPN